MKLEHVFAATNRQPDSTYWVPESDLLLASARSTLIVHRLCPHRQSRIQSFNRHSSDINRISGDKNFIATASINGEIILWKAIENELIQIKHLEKIHSDAIGSLSVINFDKDNNVICSIAGDFSLSLIGINTQIETVTSKKHLFKSIYPICVASTKIHRNNGNRQILLAVATSDFFVRFFLVDKELSAELKETSKIQIGEDWSTSLKFSSSSLNESIFLSVANKDSRVRVIKIFKQAGEEEPSEDRLQVDKKILIEDEFEIKTETILRGHSNWVTSSCWVNINDQLHLVTSSMDKSIVIWSSGNEHDEESTGVWPDSARLGDFGGANMGFLGVTAGRSDSGKVGLLAHSYNGAFYLWWWNQEQESWKSSISPSGHFGPVRLSSLSFIFVNHDFRDLSWSEDKTFLLSTSFDQTTRLYSRINISDSVFWAECARPQVHGHDIRCMTTIESNRFASGAEEKVIRVFRSTRNFRENFEAITGYNVGETEGEPEGAAVPALGLSNKAVFEKQGKVNADREIAAHESYMEDQFTALNVCCFKIV